MLIDCAPSCCQTPAPVNIPGPAGAAGTPGQNGAIILLGQSFIDLTNLSATGQSIVINAANYIVTQAILVGGGVNPAAAILAVYDTNSVLGNQIVASTTIGNIGTFGWQTLTLGAAAASGQSVLIAPTLYAILSHASTASPCSAFINLYGYAL